MSDGAGFDGNGATDETDGEESVQGREAAGEDHSIDQGGGKTGGTLSVVCGLPGVGKSTVAERIAKHLGADVLRTDIVRKELFDDPTYTDEEIATVYEEVFDRAGDKLAAGENVVLDATFVNREWRETARDVATNRGRDFLLFVVECPTPVVKRRIERRDGVSDADFETHCEFKDTFDPVELDHVVIDNGDSEAETIAQVDAQF
jgi:hypothetical protein